MTVSGALSFCGYAVTVTVLGLLVIRAVGEGAAEHRRSWGACFVAGQLAVLALTLSAAARPGMLPVLVAAAGMGAGIGVGVLGLGRRRDGSLGALARSAVLAGALCLLFPSAWVPALRAPLAEWDARSIWFFHAKALYEDGGPARAFFGDPAYAWSHPDYPLLLPAQAAWIATLQGEWDESAAKLFLLLNFAAYLEIALGLLRGRGMPVWLALPSVVFLFDRHTLGYVNGMADNHAAVCLALAALALCRSSVGSAVLAALLVGAAVNVKNEALPFAVLIGAVWAAGRWREWARRGWGGNAHWRWGRALVPGLVPWFLWMAIKADWRVANDLQLARQLTDSAWWVESVPVRMPVVAKAFLDVCAEPACGGLVVVWAAVTLLRVLGSRRAENAHLRMRVDEWRVWALAGLAYGTVFGVYLLTPKDLAWHLETSLSRVLFFPGLAVVLGALLSVEAAVGSRELRSGDV